MDQRQIGVLCVVLIGMAIAACGERDRPVIGGRISDDAITLDRSVGPDDVLLDLTNTGTRPCALG